MRLSTTVGVLTTATPSCPVLRAIPGLDLRPVLLPQPSTAPPIAYRAVICDVDGFGDAGVDAIREWAPVYDGQLVLIASPTVRATRAVARILASRAAVLVLRSEHLHDDLIRSLVTGAERTESCVGRLLQSVCAASEALDPRLVPAVLRPFDARGEVDSVAQCLQDTSLSARSVSRMLAQAGWRGLQRVCTATRVARSWDVLSESDLGVEATAFATGYGRAATLHEQFRRAIGETPADALTKLSTDGIVDRLTSFCVVARGQTRPRVPRPSTHVTRE
jgi:AraC-like DNA-binding protein